MGQPASIRASIGPQHAQQPSQAQQLRPLRILQRKLPVKPAAVNFEVLLYNAACTSAKLYFTALVTYWLNTLSSTMRFVVACRQRTRSVRTPKQYAALVEHLSVHLSCELPRTSVHGIESTPDL